MAALETDRLVLRQWRADDREPWAALNGDPRVMEHFPGTLSRPDADAFVDRHAALIEERGWGLWALEVKPGPGRDHVPFIGFTGLSVPGFAVPGVRAPCTEVGWRIAAEHWGHGYAPEAARAALRFAFVELELDEVVSFTYVGNRNSRRVMEKIGMTPVGEFDHPNLPGHRIERHVVYRIRDF